MEEGQEGKAKMSNQSVQKTLQKSLSIIGVQIKCLSYFGIASQSGVIPATGAYAPCPVLGQRTLHDLGHGELGLAEREPVEPKAAFCTRAVRVKLLKERVRLWVFGHPYILHMLVHYDLHGT